MGLLRRLTESRNVEDPRYPLTSSTLIDWLSKGQQSNAGVNVTPATALSLSAVFRSIALLSGTAASLPLHSFREGDERTRTNVGIIRNPHRDMTPFEFWELMYVHILGWGNCYARKTVNKVGQLLWLDPIHPSAVTPGRAADNTKVYEVELKDGGRGAFTDREILHIPGLGYDGTAGLSVIEMAKQAIGLGLAAEEFGARFFGSGSLMSGILQTDSALDEEKATALKARWQQKVGGVGKAHEIAVLDSGAKFQTISIPPDDAQFIETRAFQISDIARWFGIPPHMLGDVERSTSWGTGIEQQGIQFLVYTLRPWLTRFEQRINKYLMPQQTFVEYQVEGLLRADTKTRYQSYAIGLKFKFLVPNEVRQHENLPPIDGGDEPIDLGSGASVDDTGTSESMRSILEGEPE